MGVAGVAYRRRAGRAVELRGPAGSPRVGGVVRFPGSHAALANSADRQSDAVALAAPGDGHVHGGGHPVVPEVAYVVWVRSPRAHAEELTARLGGVVAARDDGIALCVRWVDTPGSPTVELRTPAFVRAVVLPAEIAVYEVELAIKPLTVLVLVIGKAQRRFQLSPKCGRDAEAIARPTAAVLRHDDDGSVRGARPVQRRRVGAFQHRDRLDVVRVDVRGRVAHVVAAHRGPGTRPVPAVRSGRVIDRDAVHDDQRLVLTEDRGSPP